MAWFQGKGWKILISCFRTSWGKNVYNNFINSDVVFESLVSVDDDELNVLTNLPGGKLNEYTEGVDGEQLRTEFVTLSATNIVSEGFC